MGAGGLEIHFQSKLNVARADIHGAGDNAECGAAEGGIGPGELGCISKIECLGAELHFDSFDDLEVFGDRDIGVLLVSGAELTKAAGGVTDGIGRGRGEGGGVEPALGRPGGDGDIRSLGDVGILGAEAVLVDGAGRGEADGQAAGEAHDA